MSHLLRSFRLGYQFVRVLFRVAVAKMTSACSQARFKIEYMGTLEAKKFSRKFSDRFFETFLRMIHVHACLEKSSDSKKIMLVCFVNEMYDRRPFLQKLRENFGSPR